MRKINKLLTGYEEDWVLNPKELLSNTFKPLNLNGVEIVNLRNEIRPQKWFKIFLLLTILSAIFYGITFSSGIYLAFPWLALLMASVIPVTVAVFLFELIKDEYFSLSKIIVIFLIGTAISFIAFVSIQIDFGSPFLSTVITGPIFEELSKLFAVIIVLKFLKVKKFSTAVFIGWIIGAGFQIAETLGYSTFYGIKAIYSNIDFIDETTYIFIGKLDPTTMIYRSIFAFGSHGLYAALEAAGFWFFTRKNNTNNKGLRFFIWVIIPIVLHSIWNASSYFVKSDILHTFLSIGMELFSFIVFIYLVDCILRESNRENNDYEESIIIDY